MTVFSIFVLAVGTPNLEQSRQEARSAQAFILAKQIKTGALPRDTPDPWGMPFKITGSDPGRLIATSYGANMSTPSSGYDDDDVSTNMLLPPHKRAMQRKQVSR